MNKAQKKIDDAVTDLVLDHTFFGTLAVSAPTYLDRDCPTACTDGTSIRFGIDFVSSLKQAEVTGLTAHEVLHIALLHAFRRGSRDPVLWNIACDYVINLILKDAGFTLPEGGLVDEQYRDLSEEEVYARLQSKSKKVKPQGWGQVEDPKDHNGKPLSSQEIEILARDIQAKVSRAQAVAKLAGTIPGDLDRLITASREPAVEWFELIRKHLTEVAKDDWSWRRPSRRSPRGIILPSLDNQNRGLVAVTIDLSGSISQSQGEQALAEALSVCQSLNLTLVIGSCDTRHYGFQEYQVGDPFPNLRGGGGTDFDHASEVLQEFIDEGSDVKCHIFLTDGDTCSWGEEIVPTIWGIHSTRSDINPPFGVKVEIPQEVTA